MIIDVTSYRYDTKFGWIKQELEFIENTFIEYLNSGFGLVSSKKQELEQTRLEDIRNLDYYTDISWKSYLYKKGEMSINYLEQSFTFSGVSYLYSQLEIKLLEIKELSKEYLPQEYKHKFDSYKPKTIRGLSTMEKLVTEITGFFDFSLTGEILTKWEILSDFREVRKRVVHYNGKLNLKPLDSEFHKKNSSLGVIISDNELILTKTYLILIMNSIREFLNQLMELIWESIKSLKLDE